MFKKTKIIYVNQLRLNDEGNRRYIGLADAWKILREMEIEIKGRAKETVIQTPYPNLN